MHPPKYGTRHVPLSIWLQYFHLLPNDLNEPIQAANVYKMISHFGRGWDEDGEVQNIRYSDCVADVLCYSRAAAVHQSLYSITLWAPSRL